jgi:hypothetical protein
VWVTKTNGSFQSKQTNKQINIYKYISKQIYFFPKKVKTFDEPHVFPQVGFLQRGEEVSLETMRMGLVKAYSVPVSTLLWALPLLLGLYCKMFFSALENKEITSRGQVWGVVEF